MKDEQNKEVKLGEVGSACSKDSDCSDGNVCVNGKCVPDITPPEDGK